MIRKPSKAVVDRVEARLYKHIVDTAVCLEGCKCETCFQRYLNACVMASDAYTPIDSPEPLQIEHFI